MLRVFRALGLAWVFLALTPQTKADQFTTFQASGAFSDGSSLSGSITVDNTTQSVSSESLTLAGPSGTWHFPGFGPTATTEIIHSPTIPSGLGITEIWTAVATSPSSFVGINLVLPGDSVLTSTSTIPLVPIPPFLGTVGPYRAGTSYHGIFDIPSLPPPDLEAIGGQPHFADGNLNSGQLTSTPEPASLTMLATSSSAIVGGFGLRRWRQRVRRS
jgi:hypothetical protein